MVGLGANIVVVLTIAIFLAVDPDLYGGGVPLALALGLIAGLTNFIPLSAPSSRPFRPCWSPSRRARATPFTRRSFSCSIQQIEGNVPMPVIQKRATELPPSLAILAVVGFGVLFGLIGALVATPLLLVIIVLVQMLSMEDVLGDRGVRAGP